MKGPLSSVVRVGVTVLLLALILWKVPIHTIAAALSSASPLPLAIGIGMGAVFLSLKVFRWGWLLRAVGVECSAAEALYSLLGGMAVGLTTPGRMGEVARSLYLPRSDRVFITSTALLDKVFDIVIIVAVGGAGCVMNGFPLPGVAMFLLAAALVTPPFLPTALLARLTDMVPLAFARRIAGSLARPLAHITAGRICLALLQAVASFGVTMIQFQLFLSAFGPAPVGATFFVLPLMVLSNLIPITLSGVGVREWASVLLLSQYGIPEAAAVNVALLIFFSNSLTPGLIGALLAPRWRTRHVDDAGGQPVENAGAPAGEVSTGPVGGSGR